MGRRWMQIPGWHDLTDHDRSRTGTAECELPVAEIGPGGTVRAISPTGRRIWGWDEGSRLPNALRIGLSELDPGHVGMVPVSAGRPQLLAVRSEAAGGWLLVDADDSASDPSGFRSLIEKMPVCATVLRSDGTVVFANREAAAFTGYDAAEMEGRPFWRDAVHPEDRRKLAGAFRRAVGGERALVSVRFLSRHRGPRLVELRFGGPSAGALVQCVAFDVTERREVEEALFQSEALYRIFLEQSPVGMLHIDAAGAVTFENHQFRQIIGESVEDAWIGRSVSEIEGLDARAKTFVRDLLVKGKAFRAATATYRRSGDGAQHLQLHGSPIHHPDGGIVGGVLMVEDRTDERRRKEELDLRSRYAAAESELRKAALSHSGEDAFLHESARIFGESARADRVSVLTNNAADDCCCHRARWWRPEVDEPGPVVILHNEEPLVRRLISDRTCLHAEGRSEGDPLRELLEKTGAREAIWMPFFDEARLGGLVVLERVGGGGPASWQGTERRLVEQLVCLFETLWSWRLAGSRFRRITSTIEDCLFTYTFDEDGERRFLFATPQIESLTGYVADEVVDHDGRWSDLILLDDQVVVEGHDESLRAGRESKTTYRVRHKDGSVRWLHEQATPETDEMGDVIASGILTDVTEQKAAEAELTEAKQQAESANRLKSAFIATMSHELRTPLGAVNGFAELLTRELADLEGEGVELPAQVIEFLEAIRDNSKRLLTLVNDLLDLSNLEVGSIELHRTDVPLHAVVMRATSKVAVPLSRKGVELHVDLCNDDPVVFSDAQRLEQVLDNLLSNAAKFTQEGSVRIRTHAGERRVTVEVYDTGVGISEAHLDRLFEPFVQEDSRLNRKFDGTGLGLSLAKHLLRLMGGRIEVESEKGVGSTFRIVLPRGGRPENSRLADDEGPVG